jgi:hypothetical protein
MTTTPPLHHQRTRKSTKAPSSSTPATLLFLVKVLLVLLILLLLPKFVIAKKARTQKAIRSLRAQCQQQRSCASLVPEESMNCVNLCTSPNCYVIIYASRPLEDGEIDIRRAREFEECLKEEVRETQKQRRREEQ